MLVLIEHLITKSVPVRVNIVSSIFHCYTTHVYLYRLANVLHGEKISRLLLWPGFMSLQNFERFRNELTDGTVGLF